MSKLTLLCFSLFLVCCEIRMCSADWLQTQIIIGNRESGKAEVYRVWFWCANGDCKPNPIEAKDLVWSSPQIPGISEVKPVYYKGVQALLASTDNGAVVFEYPSGKPLFNRDFNSSQMYINVHSVEALSDGNIAAAGSVASGIFGILYPGSGAQDYYQTTWNKDAPFGHGVVFDKNTNTLYAAGYLTLLIFKYSNAGGKGQLTLQQKIPLASYYEEANKNEPAEIEDGVHDLYPVDGEPDKLFLTTGERVFTFNKRTNAIERYSVFFQIPSKSSGYKVAVAHKGGVKSISADSSIGVVFAKPSPWYKEWYFSATNDQNYNHYSPVVLWSMPSKRICMNPDYDLTTNCKLAFNVKASFYKARVFKFVW